MTSTPRSPPGQLRQNFHNFTTFEKSEKNEKNELELTSELRSAPTKVLHSGHMLYWLRDQSMSISKWMWSFKAETIKIIYQCILIIKYNICL